MIPLTWNYRVGQRQIIVAWGQGGKDCKAAKSNFLWEGTDSLLNLDGGRDTGEYKFVKTQQVALTYV